MAVINLLLIKPKTSPVSTASARILDKNPLATRYLAFHSESQISMMKSMRVTLMRMSSSKKCSKIRSSIPHSFVWKYSAVFVSTTTHSTNLTAMVLSLSAIPAVSLVFSSSNFSEIESRSCLLSS